MLQIHYTKSNHLTLQAAKANRKDSQRLALHANTIIEAIADAVQDPRCLDMDLKARIDSFIQ